MTLKDPHDPHTHRCRARSTRRRISAARRVRRPRDVDRATTRHPRHVRRAPRLAGKAFLPVAFLARLPFSMITIGTLLLVTSTTGSLALGGLASAAAAVGTAIGGPTQGPSRTGPGSAGCSSSSCR
ncbi:hypothetical protein NKG05_26180 [Oerskovia sp. M15]